MTIRNLIKKEEACGAEHTAEKRKGLKKPRHPKRWLALLLVIALACGAGVKAFAAKNSPETVKSSYTTEGVKVCTITNALSSSGTLEPANSYTVKTLVSAEILSDAFEEGDIVEKGQLLYTLDSSDAATSQTQAQNSYSQAQKSYDQAVEAKYPTADMSGTVSEVYVQNGDSVNAGTELLKIAGDNNIYMDFQFSYAAPSDFYVGQSAAIYITGFAGTLQGTVQQVSTSTWASGNADGSGRQMTTVRVKATNPGLITADYTASAVIGNYSSYGETSIKISGTSVITAGTSGKITGFSYLAGDLIQNGDSICTITGDNVDNQIENARISLNNASTSLQNTQDKLDGYKVTAPISGTVVTKTAKAGDSIEGGSAGALCTIYDLSYLEMTMSIDELDISDVAVGQTVQVTADAVEDKTYTGVVTKVSVAGTTSGGITTYPVTVRIDETDGLLPGMNVDAEIVIVEKDGVLAVPSGAVNRGNTVLITSDSPSAANALEREAPEGYVYVQVETGISDDSYTEITSGLQEGDTVAYIAVSGNSGGMGMMGGMPGGGMPGGMPSGGGMPGGGMPGGGGSRGGF